ncbi:MAG TPA: polysaccharide biosynthesis/export family protein [Planctomycetota bacterium]|nr:polysaccharide biosynthesis/export family protein [Planctomycetota bacterium]
MVRNDPSGVWSARPYSVGPMQRALRALPVVLLIVLCACSAPGPYPVLHTRETPVPPPVQGPLVLEPGSQMEVKFFYTPELDTAQQVRPDGKISLPLIGDIEVAGRTPESVRGQLLERYAGKLVDPEINVIVRTWPNRRVLVSGQVLKPGVYDMTGSMTVLEAVMFAGGPDFREGDVSEVIVIRREGKDCHGYLVDLEPTLAGEAATPFELRPLDVVYVPRTGIAEVNQWVRQYITNMVPELELFWRYPVGQGTIGIGTGQ